MVWEGVNANKIPEKVYEDRILRQKEEIEKLKEQIKSARRYGWSQILEMSERQLAALQPTTTSVDIGTAKDTRTVVSDRVKVLHNHEAKCKALEVKLEKATANIEKHHKAKGEAVRVEKERHEKRLKAIDEDFARMIKAEQDVMKEAKEALRIQAEKFEEADGKYHNFLAKQVPVDDKPCITPEMISSDLIAAHLKSDDRLKGILDPQAEGVAQSLCNLLNLLVEPQLKGNAEEISDMELDENERAAEDDHQKAQEMIDGGKKGIWKAGARRKRGKQAGPEQMDQTESTAGKRGSDEAETEQPPPPKCLTLPADGAKTQHFNLVEGDAAAAATEAAKKTETETEEVKQNV